MRGLKRMLFVLAATVVCAQWAVAVPTFQVYSPDATAGDWGADEDTWLVSDSAFDLVVVGAYGPHTASLDDVTLLVSVPDGQTGSITITGGDGTVLLTSKTAVADGYYNPNADVDSDILTNVGGLDGYDTKTFIPESVNFNNHYPFQEGVSDFVLYGLGTFDNLGPVNDYNADTGVMGIGAGQGEEKTYSVSVSGFEWVHFDAYGYNVDTAGVQQLKSTWEINPGSHDVTFIPAPGAVMLGSLGMLVVGWLRRMRTL